MSKLANCRSQLLLDGFGRCLKLFVLSESTSCHKFASQFGLAIFYMRKTHKTSGNRITLACVYLNEAPTGHSWPAEQAKRGGVNFFVVGRTLTHRTATTWTLTAVGGRRVRDCVCVCVCVCACVMCVLYTIILFDPG